MTTTLCSIAIALTGLACAQSGERPATSPYPRRVSVSERLADAPRWVTEGCRTHWTDAEARRGIVCGVGSAPSNRNRRAAQETAVARARSAIARSVTVTIENLVRLDDTGTGDGELRSIVHQLTSASLPACQLETVWQSSTGEIHALVSLQVAKVQDSVRTSRSLSSVTREDLAQRAATAFAAMDANSDPVESDGRPGSSLRE